MNLAMMVRAEHRQIDFFVRTTALKHRNDVVYFDVLLAAVLDQLKSTARNHALKSIKRPPQARPARFALERLNKHLAANRVADHILFNARWCFLIQTRT